ncbi:MAG: penicillin-binding protein, partial [Firmicutes bacterium]|nr:penicillin-binding protein [Bacillota bacterium]
MNPCSMMILCGAVANGGRSAMPHLISKITTGEGLRVSLYYNHSTDRLLQGETAAYLRQAMLDNVTYGYGDYYFPELSVG